jgi:hypothetical protein
VMISRASPPVTNTRGGFNRQPFGIGRSVVG